MAKYTKKSSLQTLCSRTSVGGALEDGVLTVRAEKPMCSLILTFRFGR